MSCNCGIRNEDRDWTTQLVNANNALGNTTTINDCVVYNNVVWYVTNDNGTTPNIKNYLTGYNTSDGTLYGQIELPSTGTVYANQLTLLLDQNNYIWVEVWDDAPVAIAKYFVCNPATKTLINTVTYDGTRGPRPAQFDSTNNLVWTISNVNIFQAFSSVTYTLDGSKTITVPRPLGNELINGWTINTVDNELWFFFGTSKIKVYDLATLTEKTTLTSNFTGASSYMSYVPELHAIILSGTNATLMYEIWDCSTKEIIKTIPLSVGIFNARQYNPCTKEFIGPYFISGEPSFFFGSFKYEDYTQRTLYSDTSTTATGGNAFRQSGVFTLDKNTGSVYTRLYDSGGFLFYAHKIALVKHELSDQRILLPSTEDTSSDYSNVNNFDVFNRELILDMTLMAFSVYDISHSKDAGSPFIRDYLFVPPYTLETTLEDIYRGTDLVTDGAGVTLTITGGSKVNTRTTDERQERFKFLATKETFISLVEYNSYSFKDWVSVDGVGLDFNSYLLTGYELTGEMMRQKQAIYLKLYFDRTEDSYILDDAGNVVLAHQSGCKVQSQWNWNNSFEQGKWGIPFQGYRLLKTQPTNPSAGDVFNYAERVVVTKNKLRGRGHCVSLLFVSDSGKDTKLLGWGMNMTGNNTV